MRMRLNESELKQLIINHLNDSGLNADKRDIRFHISSVTGTITCCTIDDVRSIFADKCTHTCDGESALSTVDKDGNCVCKICGAKFVYKRKEF